MADNSVQIQNLKGLLASNQASLAAAKQTLAQLQSSGASSADIAAQKNLVDGRILGVNAIITNIKSLQTSSIDATPKPAPTVVNSGSGTKSSSSVNAEAVAAGDFSYGKLGNGTAGGLGNSALFDTKTILPNTQKTQVSKAQLEAADHQYTIEMNKLSNYWANQDTSSPEYLAQKQIAMSSQYNWELARNNLEEVATSETANSVYDGPLQIEEPLGDPIDLSGVNQDLVPVAPTAEETPVVDSGNSKDRRLRLRPKEQDGSTFPFFGDKDSILYGLNETYGVIFPYTPTITYSHNVAYSEMAPTHANTSYHIYTNTPAVQIQIEAQFSSQNAAEAKYTLAAMHFFRSATKMHFGENDPNSGMPPPPLVLSGYGEFMFNDLTVLLKDFSMAMPNNVDYVEVEVNGSAAWVPALTTFNLTCIVQQTPKQQRRDFILADFASGKMMGDPNRRGWI